MWALRSSDTTNHIETPQWIYDIQWSLEKYGKGIRWEVKDVSWYLDGRREGGCWFQVVARRDNKVVVEKLSWSGYKWIEELGAMLVGYMKKKLDEAEVSLDYCI